ncbi:MAG: hypothetical protein AAF938_29190 [Myxococcota bacterium]
MPVPPNYIVSGLLKRDATKYLSADCYQWAEPEVDAAPFIEKLSNPEPLNALLALLRSQTLPRWAHFHPDSLGRNLQAGEHAFRVYDTLHFMEDSENWIDRHYALATDGSFNLHVLVADGRVGVLSKEFDGILGDWFPDLDAYLFTMLRLSLVSQLGAEQVLRDIGDVEGAEEYVLEIEEML